MIATANESSSSFFRLLNSPLRRTHFNVVGAGHTCTRTQNQLMSVIEDYAVSTAEDVHLDRVCSLLTCSSSFSAKTSYAIVHSRFARNYVICSSILMFSPDSCDGRFVVRKFVQAIY